MSDFLKFFDEVVQGYPMHLEIYYSKIMYWIIEVYKGTDPKIDILFVQSNDIELVFAMAQVELKEWLVEKDGGY